MRHNPMFLLSFVATIATVGACDDGGSQGQRSDATHKDQGASDQGRLDLGRQDLGAVDLGVGDLGTDARTLDASLPDAEPPPDLGPPGGDRPAKIYAAEGAGPHPILLVLHGYQINATTMLNSYRFHQSAPARGVIVVAPDGTKDETGARFWDAEHCCPEREVDDVGYLLGLIDEVVARYDGDASQVYVFGHSNGGYMAHHLACVAADRFAGIFSVSGLGYPRDRCQPARNLAVWQLHGTEDEQVPYAGSETQPGADALVDWWAGQNGCTGSMDLPPANYVDFTPGDETTPTHWSGCAVGADVVRWRMEGVPHIILANAAFIGAVVDRIAPR